MSFAWSFVFMKGQRRNEKLIKAIAIRLRELRLERKLTQETIYFDTEIHLARIESGKLNISVSTLSELCDYYGVTLEEFFRNIETH